MPKRAELYKQVEHLWDKLFYGTPRPNTLIAEPPWDPWEIDHDFLKTLSRWNEDHPESTLERVFGKINSALEKSQPLFELIPDNPFPARGLVTALTHLVNLGWKVTRAKSDVQDFASQIVHWVTEMTKAFKEGRLESGIFAWRTRRNLEERSSLIREICVWAATRLHDSRWLQVSKGLSISGEINEFKDRLAEAKALFLDLSMVTLSQGVDDICREIKLVRELQQKQLGEIMDALETQKQAEERRQFMDRVLQSRIVVNPGYDEQGKRPCDPETRVEILARINAWINDLSPGGKSFLWLTGDPGSGKSAITASIARECKDAQILWAQFFINRNSVETTNPKSFFPSIARQLANHYPGSEVAIAIHDALQKKQSLVDDISPEQALKLFVDALEVAAKLDTRKPVVVVIDGLDECDRARLMETAEIFSGLFKSVKYPNAKVFIASRTDDEIRKPFAVAYHDEYVKHVHLDTAEESSIRDVSTFIKQKIAKIVEIHDLNWEEWPGEERLAALCIRASGLFIWAVTSIKFIQEQIEALGTECLNDLLDALSFDGMGDINTLYGTILSLTYHNATDPEWAYETFRRVVGCIVTLREPLSVGAIRVMLDLRKTEKSNPVDITNFVRRLRTVLVAGADAVDKDTVPRLHKSFFEYITSTRAETRFRVNLNVSHGELLRQCLSHLADFHQLHCKNPGNQPPTSNTIDSVPAVVQYAVSFWASHTPREAGAPSGVAVISETLSVDEVRELKTAVNGKGVQRSLGIERFMDRSRTLTSWGTEVRVLGGHPFLVTPSKGHTRRVNSVAFSPNGMRLVSGSDDNTIRLWDGRSGQPIGSPLQGHTGGVCSIAFSSDGMRLASGSFDKTIRLWDAQSGRSIGSPLQGHTESVRSVGFSPDGTRLISGSADDTLKLWDTQSGESVGSPLQGHTNSVRSVGFSPDGTCLVSGSADDTVRLWNAKSGQPIISPLRDHTETVSSVSFSPDGSRIASGSLDHCIRMWDAQSGRPVGDPLQGHTDQVYSVAFSPDGKHLVSGSFDKTIRLWDSLSGKPVGSPLTGHTDAVTSVAFSPDGCRIASGGWDNTVRLWDVRTGRPAQATFPHTSSVSSMAIFPDGRRLVSASSDNSIQIWDTNNYTLLSTLHQGNPVVTSCLCVSPDGSIIAAADLSGHVRVWDAATYQLVSHVDTYLEGMTSISFSPSGDIITLSHIDSSTSRWKFADGKLSAAPTTPTSTIVRNEILSLDRKEGCIQRDEAKGNAVLRWLPSDDPDAGLWGYVDGKVIRRNGVDSVTIFDVGGDTG